jgi:hypothetical protein
MFIKAERESEGTRDHNKLMNRVMGLILKEQQCQQSPKNKSSTYSRGSKDAMQGIEFKPAVHQGLIVIATTDQGLTGD